MGQKKKTSKCETVVDEKRKKHRSLFLLQCRNHPSNIRKKKESGESFRNFTLVFVRDDVVGSFTFWE